MLTGQNIVYFGDYWDGVLRNRQQLMSIFARSNKVLFVERGNSLQATLKGLRGGSLGLSELRRPLLRQELSNLYVFREPGWAPASEKPGIGQLTRWLRQLALHRTMAQLGISQPIVWFYHPCWLDAVNSIPSAQLQLYHVVDEYTSFQDKTLDQQRYIADREKQLIKQVDAVVVVSDKLYKAKAPLHPNTYLVANGVNYQAYSDAMANESVPDELAQIPSPRLGYSGLIGDKLDLDMLKAMAETHQDWSLILLGPVNASKKKEVWQALRDLPNVHHFGPVNWVEVPNYVKNFDVGLMPYVQNRNSDNISPLKLYDYLAAGLPIVSMDIPAAREFKDHLHLASHPEDFAEAIQTALLNNSSEQRQARQAVAAQHTWESRVEQLSTLIKEQLAQKLAVAL